MQAALDLNVHSLMAVPLRARGVVLGLLVVSRAEGREAFGRDDIALAWSWPTAQASPWTTPGSTRVNGPGP